MTHDGSPAPGTRDARPRYRKQPELKGKLTREQKLERQLARARWERDRWQRRYRLATKRTAALEARRSWVEGYLGFRVEYAFRGRWRGFKRRLRGLRRKLR